MGFADVFTGDKPDTNVEKMNLWNAAQRRLFRNMFVPLVSGDELTKDSISQQSPLAGTSLAALEQMAMQYGSGQTGFTEGGQAGAQSLMDMLSGGPQDINDYFTKTVQDPMMESFREDVMPGISRKYSPSGFYSSQRIQSEDRARENLLDALTKSRADISYKAYGDDLTRKLTAGQALLGADKDALTGLFGAASVGMDVAKENQRRKEARANMMLMALGLRPYEYSTTVEPGTPGMLNTLIGGMLGAGGQVGGGFASRKY